MMREANHFEYRQVVGPDEWPVPAHILLVEDNPADARAVAEAFDQLHILNSMTFAHTVEEAKRALADRRKPDLIILDLVLGRRSGFDLLRECPAIKEHEIPVVIYSHYQPDNLDALCLEAGARAFIPKPLTIDGLAMLVAEIDEVHWAIVTLAARERVEEHV